MSEPIDYLFRRQAARLINTGATRTIVATGNVQDLFFVPPREGGGRGNFIPLLDYLTATWTNPVGADGKPIADGPIVVQYEVNYGIRIPDVGAEDDVARGYDAWCAARKAKRTFKDDLAKTQRQDVAIDKPTGALEVLRQLCLIRRCADKDGLPYIRRQLLILIEGADLLIPNAPIAQLNEADRYRVAIFQDWFTDHGFQGGKDTVLLLAESRSQMHDRIAKLPVLEEVVVGSPDLDVRRFYIDWWNGGQTVADSLASTVGVDELAKSTAPLSIIALRQLLVGATRVADGSEKGRRVIPQAELLQKRKDFIVGQLGEGVVDFKQARHTTKDVIGSKRVLAFAQKDYIERVRRGAIRGALITGSNGSGKSFVWEAVAAELGMLVLELKGIRSKWFGDTDLMVERLYRLLCVLPSTKIFIDEADTVFGGVGADTHETERRLTGRFQNMMSDGALKHIFWLLLTARPQNLSPDIRRPGRVGDLSIPMLDPEGDDRTDYLRWIASTLDGEITGDVLEQLDKATVGHYAASFSSLRQELTFVAESTGGKIPLDRMLATIKDLMLPAIARERRYQNLQALVHTTRRSLLPNPDVTDEERAMWVEEIRELEAQGIR